MDPQEPSVDAIGTAFLAEQSKGEKRAFELENMKELKYVRLFLSVAVMLGTPESMAFDVDSY